MNAKSTLKKNSDFRRLYSKGKSAVTPYFVIYARPNRSGVNRTGYTVSKKLGKAVHRNRIRRRLREIYRLNSCVLKQGYDIILVARAKCFDCEFDALQQAFLRVCHELALNYEE